MNTAILPTNLKEIRRCLLVVKTSARIVKIYEGILLLVKNQGVQLVIAAFLKNRCYEIESGGIFEVII